MLPLRELLKRHHGDEISTAPNDKPHHLQGEQGNAREAPVRNHIISGFSKLGLSRKLPGRPNHNRETGGSSSRGRQLSVHFEDEENLLQNLLPGIPDRVTIEGILTKTSWRTLCTLAAVNRAWRRAIQSRRVYRARNYINSTKTLAAIIHQSPAPQSAADYAAANRTRSGRFVPAHWRFTMSLYDPAEDSWHRLPPIPGVSCGIPKSCGCAFLNGKLYVIGGDDYDKVQSKKEVYMIDLAACRGVWQKCATMQNGRSEFPCEVNNGRIYVFGGGYQSEVNYSRDAEVFDPERNEWHPVADMMSQRTNHTVVPLEGKLYVIGGSVWLDEEDDLLYQRLGDCDDMFDSTLHARFAEVYDPWKKYWRKVENVTRRETDDAFVVVHGKLHVLRPDSVHVYDVQSNSWTFLQHISWENQACVGAKDCSVSVAAFIEGELLALVGRTREEDYGLSLLRSTNFCRRNCQITWEAVSCPHEFDSQFFALHPIQL
ncbi:unnamed protein product [Calypogeia fissa]